MELAITIILFVIGLILIIKGGDTFVEAAIWFSEITGIPKAIIGATVVSLATTLPEMLVSFIAAAEGKVDMAIGNGVGSVTANTGLIMGLAIVCLAMTIERKDYLPKSVLVILSAAILVFFGSSGSIGLFPNIILIILFILAMAENIREARKAIIIPSDDLGENIDDGLDGVIDDFDMDKDNDGKPEITNKNIIINVLKFIIGAAAIILGAQLLVDNGSELARLFGIPERIIGVTVIAIGTSLPELVTTISAIRKKEGALSIGNILGANIIDLTLIIPVCSLISGKALPVSEAVGSIDLTACLIIITITLVPALIMKKFNRTLGVIVIMSYLLYVLITTGII